jgi:hypothetical protein
MTTFPENGDIVLVDLGLGRFPPGRFEEAKKVIAKMFALEHPSGKAST